MKSGILLIDKPEGPTSARIVQRVKGVLGGGKVGHLGSLDPFASGLLLVGVNEGTKIAQIFLNAEKSYTGTITLGVETDTQDRTGKVLGERAVPSLAYETLESLRGAFSGSQWQVPPMFSALKRDGVPLYRMARQGKSVPRTMRPVEIRRLRLWALNAEELGFEVTCSKGTYIRTLAADMGTFLGCGGHLKILRRLTCGHFRIDQAISPEEFHTQWDHGDAPLVPLAQALGPMLRISLDPSLASRLRSGRQEFLSELGFPKDGEDMAGLVDGAGNLVALAQRVEEGKEGGGQWRLLRVFAPPTTPIMARTPGA